MEIVHAKQNCPRRKKTRIVSLVTTRRRAAFTLLEIALVLAISGFIISVVWSAANSVWENYKVTTAMQQVIKSASNIRDDSAALQNWPAAWQSAGFDITQTLDGLNLLPVEMRSNLAQPGATNMNHALTSSSVANGSFHVLTETNPVTGAWNIFRVELQGLSQSGCVKFLMQTPLSDASMSIVRLTVNGTSEEVVQSYTGTGGTPVWNPVLPFTSASASSWCSLTTPTNEVDLDLKLHN
jgi:hypothetical protein